MQQIYKDDFGNVAMIAAGRGYPYKGAPEKVTDYTLSLFAEYDDYRLYHLAVYETEAEAEAALKNFSIGTFKPEAATA